MISKRDELEGPFGTIRKTLSKGARKVHGNLFEKNRFVTTDEILTPRTGLLTRTYFDGFFGTVFRNLSRGWARL